MSNADRIAMSARLRQLSKEMTLGDPKTAAMLISAAKMVERGSYGPNDGQVLIDRSLLGTAELHLMAFLRDGKAYSNTSDVLQRVRETLRRTHATGNETSKEQA